MVIPRSYRGSRSLCRRSKERTSPVTRSPTRPRRRRPTGQTKDLDETHSSTSVRSRRAPTSSAFRADGGRAWATAIRTPKDYPKGATVKVGNTFNPLGADVALDVTPATGLVYGRVTDGEGFAMDSVTVTANGVSTMTDAEGRYILDGISPETRKIKQQDAVQQASSWRPPGDRDPRVRRERSPQPHDINLSSAASGASVSGTVRASGTNAPVAGVEITVDGDAPTNKATRGTNARQAGDRRDGTYTAEFPAKDLGESATVRASKTGMTFVPGELATPAHPGADISGLDFVGFVNATISGRVRCPGGRAMSDVTVTATAGGDDRHAELRLPTPRAGREPSRSTCRSAATTSQPRRARTRRGQLPIPTGFGTVNVAPGQTVNVGTIQAKSANARNVSAARQRLTGRRRTPWTSTNPRRPGVHHLWSPTRPR